MKKLILLLAPCVLCGMVVFAETEYTGIGDGQAVITETVDIQTRIEQIDKDINYLTWVLLPAINDGLTMARHPEIVQEINRIIQTLKDQKSALEELQK